MSNKKVSILVCVLAMLSTQMQATTVDNAKSGKTKVDKKDGVTVIDIDTPNKDKVSVNNFTEFNVVDKGTVINNMESGSHYKTVIGPTIKGNENISAGKEADIAIFNVKGSTTELKSTLEAASNKALKVYIANEDGIKVDGARFVNIDKLVLTSGVIDESDMAVLVRKGNVNISNKGIAGLKNLSIFAETLDNKGNIAAENLNIVLGHNFIKNEKSSYTLDSNYVSATNLGSIYGNEIKLQSTGYTDININELLAKNNIDLSSKGKVINNGKIMAEEKVAIKAKDLVNKGKVTFNKDNYELRWIDSKGNIYTKEQLEKIWNKKMKKTLTNKDTAIYLTGSLLNQWFTDERHLKRTAPNTGIFKRFDDTLNEFNNTDANTFLIREGKNLVEEKHKKRDFVNKGDIYATEINDKKILEAVVISKVKADQAIISAKNVDINVENELLNQDALIDGKENVKIKAKKLVNKNTLSDEIKLNDGYEHVDWDLRVIKKDIAAEYDITYERGLVDVSASRKTKISAVNTSKIKGKNVNLEVEDVKLEDEINTGLAIEADKLTTKTKNLNLQGQVIEAKNFKAETENLTLKNASISTNETNIKAKNIDLLTKKDKEVVIKTDKETLTKEVVSSSSIYGKNKLVIQSDKVNLLGSILKSDGTLGIRTYTLNNKADVATKDYKSSYDISKTYRKIKHNEKNQRPIASFIYGKNLVIEVKKNNTVGSYIVGVDKINYRASKTKIDALKVNNELERNYGVDNGILGVNYNKVKKIENEAMGSIVLSKGDIKAKIEKELELVGSNIKGKKVKIEAENIEIKDKKVENITETESRHLLSGDLNGTVNIDKQNMKITVDMEAFKKEKTTVKEEVSTKSQIVGEEVELIAKDKNKITGSDIEGDKVTIKGKKVEIEDSVEKTDINKNETKVTTSNKFTVNEANLESANSLVIEKNDENLKIDKSKGSTIKAKSEVKIEGEDVTVKGSKVEAKEVEIKAKNKVEIKNGENKEEYDKTSEKITLASNVKVDAKVFGIVQTLKKIVEERENLLGYALNPVAGYQKAKEYKGLLKKNIDNFKSLVENIKANKIDPESLGIALTTEGVIKYDQNFIKSITVDNAGSLISGEKVKIIADKEVNLKGSKVKGDEVEIKAEKVTLEKGEKRKDANETVANMGVTAKHEVISKNTSGKLDGSVQNKGNYTKETVSSEIEAKNIDLKSEELNLENSKIKAETGKVETKKLNIDDKAEKETKYGITVSGMYDNGPKIGAGSASAKVEHTQEVKNHSEVKVENGEVKVGEKEEKKEAKLDINVNLAGGLNVDPEGKVKSKVNGGVEGKVKKKGKNIKGVGSIGVSGGLELEDGEITDGSVSAELKGDLTVNDVKNIEEMKIKIEDKLTINKDGEINNDLSVATDATIKADLENLKGKLKLSAKGDLTATNNGIEKLKGSLNADGDLEAKFNPTETVEAIIKLKGNAKVDADKDNGVSASGNIGIANDLTIEGKKDEISGKLHINSDANVSLDSEKGVTDYEANAKADGNIKVEGKNDFVNGSLDLSGKTELNLKKDQEAKIKAEGDLKADATIEGKVKDLIGKLNINLDSSIKADNQNGITDLTANLATKGNLEADFNISENIKDKIKLMLDAKVSAAKGKELDANAKIGVDNSLNISGKAENLSGGLNINTISSVDLNNKDGLKDYALNNKLDGKVTINGKTNNVEGDLTIASKAEVDVKKGKETSVSGEATLDGHAKVNGQIDKLKGDLEVTVNSKVAGNNKDGLTEAAANLDGKGKVEAEVTTEHINDKIKLEAAAKLKAEKGKEVEASADVAMDNKFTASGDAENLNGNVTIDTSSKVSLDNKTGIKDYEVANKAEGNVTVAGKTQHVDGSANLNAKGEIVVKKGEETKVSGEANLKSDVTVKGETNNVSGDLNVKLDTTIAGNNKDGLTDAKATVDGKGKVEAKVETDHIIDKFKLEATGKVEAAKGKEVEATANIDMANKFIASGTAENINGNISINTNSNISLDSKDGVKDYGVTNKADGVVNVAGKTENVEGSATVSAKAEVAVKKDQKTTVSGETGLDAKAKINGKTEHVNGDVELTLNSKIKANNTDGITEATAKLNGTGNLEANVETANLKDTLKLHAKGTVEAAKGKEVVASADVNAENKLHVEGTADNLSGNLDINTNSSLSVNSNEGIKNYEVNNELNGKVNVAGQTDHVKGDATVVASGTANIKKGEALKLSGEASLDANTNIAGEADNVKGNVDLALKSKVKGNNAEGVTEANATLKGNGEVEANFKPSDNVNASIKLKADTLTTADKKDGVNAKADFELENKLNVKGEVEHISGHLNAQSNSKVSLDSNKGVTNHETTAKADGALKVEGETDNVKGYVDFKGNTEINIKNEETPTIKGEFIVNSNAKIEGLIKELAGKVDFDFNSSIKGESGKGITEMMADLKSKGDLEAKFKPNKFVDYILKLRADAHVLADKDKGISASANIDANNNLKVQGEAENISGKFELNTDSSLSVDSEKGVKDFKTTATTNGDVKVEGTSEHVSGNVIIKENSELTINKDETPKLSGEVSLDSKVKVQGQTENVNGDADITVYSVLQGETGKGITKLFANGNLKSRFAALFNPNKNLMANININTDSNVNADINKGISANTDLGMNNKLVIEGEKEHISGKVDLSSDSNLSLDSEAGVKDYNVLTKLLAKLRANGKKGIIAGNLDIDTNSELNIKKDQEPNLKGEGTLNSNISLEKTIKKFNGKLDLLVDGKVKAETGKGIEVLDTNFDANGNISIDK